MIYLVTGWPGAGKSTVAVQHAIERYATKGRRVVCNFPMDFAPICMKPGSALSNTVVEVISDRPTRADLDAIGVGGEREETAGMLIVDEAGGWLNARTWNGGERDKIIDWLTQSRKRMWDVYLIAQAPGMLDKQVREAVCEGVVRIRRFDRFKLAGVSMPRVHIAVVRYGLEANAPVLERWIYRGTEAHKCFGSYRVFGTDDAPYSVLPASLTKWRSIARRVLNSDGRRGTWLAVVVALVLMFIKPLGGVVLGLGIWWFARYWGSDWIAPRVLRFKREPKRLDQSGGMGGRAPHAERLRLLQASVGKREAIAKAGKPLHAKPVLVVGVRPPGRAAA